MPSMFIPHTTQQNHVLDLATVQLIHKLGHDVSIYTMFFELRLSQPTIYRNRIIHDDSNVYSELQYKFNESEN